MATIPDIEPTAITAGDTVTWTRTLPDYPASAGWVLSYTLINADRRVQFAAVADGDAHRVHQPAAVTAEWPVGDFEWQAVVANATDRHTVLRGRLSIQPDFGSMVGLDTRSMARKALEALQAAYLDYLTNQQGHVAEYEIAGRRMKFRNAAEIWAQIDRLKREVAAEDRAARIAAGLPARRRVLVRFGG